MAKKNRKKKVEVTKTRNRTAAALDGWLDEIFGVIFLLAAAVVLLSLASFSPSDPAFDGSGLPCSNLVGLVGAYLADGLLYALGVTAFILVVGLAYSALVAFTRGALRVTLRKALGYLALTVQGTALFQIAFAGEHLLGHAPGGILGEYAGGLFVTLLSSTGSIVVLCAGIVMGLISATGFSVVRTAREIGRGLASAGLAGARATAWAGGRCGRGLASAGRVIGRWLVEQGGEFVETLRHSRTVELAEQAMVAGPAAGFLMPPVTCPPLLGRREPVVVFSEPPPGEGPTEMDERESAEPVRRIEDVQRKVEPEIVIPRHQEREPDDPAPAGAEEAKAPPSQNSQNWANLELPSLDMLESEEQQEAVIDKDMLHEHARRLEQKLSDYGISGQVTKIMPGPVVTMYEYAPGPGIKVAKISGLSQDLALALEAMSVRIIAPIPGRAVVGIEVSNKTRQMVYAKEIIGHKSFARSRSRLTMALGKDIEGTPCVADLNKMPHLLVAGATGTGKSVSLNCIITSILYRATPQDVRFIMIDPKVLELSLYDGIPHLLLPVVTDPRKAQAALQWTVNEMDRRIQILHGAGVRNLDSFNAKAERQAKAEEVAPEVRKRKKIIVIDKTAPTEQEERVEIEVDAADEPEVSPEEPRLTKMPHIVIVIDELADLMLTAGRREVETNIVRIAQKARAAGIHLIVATQRPSVDVITGLIKANLPARISFRVAQKVDSRTILDANGAECLLGNGDMLFHPPTSSQLIRVHGAFISEQEITRVVAHLKAQAEPVYDETILASAEEDQEDSAEGEDDFLDEMYDLAVQIVAEMGQASTSMVQRKLRIGYNRAARLIERMEREGIVGPPDGSRPRKLLIQNHAP